MIVLNVGIDRKALKCGLFRCQFSSGVIYAVHTFGFVRNPNLQNANSWLARASLGGRSIIDFQMDGRRKWKVDELKTGVSWASVWRPESRHGGYALSHGAPAVALVKVIPEIVQVKNASPCEKHPLVSLHGFPSWLTRCNGVTLEVFYIVEGIVLLNMHLNTKS